MTPLTKAFPLTSPRPVRRLDWLLGLPLALLLVLWSAVVPAANRVEAQLSGRDLAFGQPAELTLTIQGESAPQPDLSVLDPDFRILDRRVERQVSIRNGQRNEQVRLSLLLLPRRDGDLLIPPIPVGQTRTAPLTLHVQPDPGLPTESAAAPLFVNPSPWPATPLPATAAPTLPAPPAPPAQGPQAPPPTGTTGSNPWFWISVGLAGALAAVLGSRRRAPTPAAPSTAAEPEPVPPSPLEEALERVRLAYASADAGASRGALLAWGRLRWPEAPPGNLARLAQRCPPPLREHITRLEMAFFSPEPIPWEHEPVARELAELIGTSEQPTGA